MRASIDWVISLSLILRQEFGDHWMREVALAFGKSDGKFARGINVADQNICQRLVSRATRIPCLDYPINFVKPRHRNSSSGFEHDDGVKIRCCDLLDQFVLIIRKRKIR